MYHYVRPIKGSRYSEIKGLEYSDFIEQILFIKKHYNPISMQEAINSFYNNEKLPENAVLLTFDDAYSDHFKYVYPILKKNGIQGSFYAPAKTIADKEILDVNKIHFILASCTDINILIKKTEVLFDKYKVNYNVRKFHEYFEELAIANRFDFKEVIFFKRLLQFALPEKMRGEICDELFKAYVGIDESAFCDELYMNQDQLKHLVSDGMHIGSHGYNHYWWNKLDIQTLSHEIDKSLDFLSSLNIDTKNWTACYPYGSSSDEVVQVLKNKGCKLAFTTTPDVAQTNITNPLLIPRLDTNDLPKISTAKPNSWYR
ncbi:polysaccharide deacetylase family protein [Providencia rettgeri]|nr:polysaccharide deacetylase family protein [Providencia rettgeri]